MDPRSSPLLWQCAVCGAPFPTELLRGSFRGPNSAYRQLPCPCMTRGERGPVLERRPDQTVQEFLREHADAIGEQALALHRAKTAWDAYEP